MSYNIDDNASRYFSFYRTFDDLMEEYLRQRTIEIQRGNTLNYDFTDSQTIKSSVPDTYPDTNLLSQFIDNFEQFSQKIDSGGSFKKAKIKLSEDKRFQFSFSLASKGLTRVIEYYNAEIAKKYPTLYNSIGLAASDETMVAGVVDLNSVLSKPLANNKAYFYVVINGVEYQLRQQQKGTAKMLQINPTANLEQVDGDGMFYTEPSFYKNFSLVFSSTFKKSYLELPKKGGNAKAVDIFVPFDMIYSTTTFRISPSIPLLLASKYFTQARIKVRINIMRPIIVDNTVSIIAITVKDFQDPLDWNKIAVMRGMYGAGEAITEMNASIIAFKNNLYYTTTSNSKEQEYSAYPSYLLYDDEQLLQTEFGRYKNWLKEEVEEGRIKTALVDKPLMLTFSTQGSLGSQLSSEIASRVANDPNRQFYIDREVKRIEKDFFEIIDLVDLYYNEKLSEVVSRIKKRFDEEGKSNYDLKSYFIKLLGKLYRDLEPDTGVFASSVKDIEKSYEKYEITLAKLKKEYEKRGI
jgi:hypothetical protein